MAVETKRGCGYRKIGGTYICGTGLSIICERLPLRIPVCPVCGETIRFLRSIRRINPKKLFGECQENHICHQYDCKICDPPEKGWVMWVGREYTPESFTQEAEEMGVSKRIPFIPEDLKIGDWVYLAHNNVFKVDKKHYEAGIFYAFKVTKIEKIITTSQSKNKKLMDSLKEKNIVPVIVPDDDPDHMPKRTSPNSLAEEKRETLDKYFK